MPRINAPSSIAQLMQKLPIRARGFVQGTRLVIPNQLSVRPEHPQTTFSKGEVSVEPSSGNVSIHLQDTELEKAENLLGKISSEFNFEMDTTSVGILIAAID